MQLDMTKGKDHCRSCSVLPIPLDDRQHCSTSFTTWWIPHHRGDDSWEPGALSGGLVPPERSCFWTTVLCPGVSSGFSVVVSPKIRCQRSGWCEASVANGILLSIIFFHFDDGFLSGDHASASGSDEYACRHFDNAYTYIIGHQHRGISANVFYNLLSALHLPGHGK